MIFFIIVALYNRAHEIIHHSGFIFFMIDLQKVVSGWFGYSKTTHTRTQRVR